MNFKKPTSRSLLWLMPLSLVAIVFLVYWFLPYPRLVIGHEPVRPFPYKEEEVSFVNPRAGVTLAGTLTLPRGNGPFPAVLIIGGSGPHRRDGYNLATTHKFIVLSDYLTRQGIATLRFDKRGIGDSSGDYQNATEQDFADDAGFGVEYLSSRKEIDAKKIGLIGHSEGGVVAPIVAAHSSKVAFVVMMAGPGIPGGKILLRRREMMDKMRGAAWAASFWQQMVRNVLEEIKNEKDQTVVQRKMDEIEKRDLAPVLKDDPMAIAEAETYWRGIGQTINLFSPWGRFFLSYDPKTSLTQVKCPLLAISGEKDGFVPPNDSFPAIYDALNEGGNKDHELKLFPNVNHGFQACKPDASDEPADDLQAIAPEVLVFVGDWIGKHVK